MTEETKDKAPEDVNAQAPVDPEDEALKARVETFLSSVGEGLRKSVV